MAFKTRDPNETQAQRDASVREMHDRSAFGHDVGKGEKPIEVATFRLLSAPVADLTYARMLARDKDGFFEVRLMGDRNPGSDVRGETWLPLAQALASQGDDPRAREGLPVLAAGVFGRLVGQNWRPGDNGFQGGRGFAVATADIELGNGAHIRMGRPLEIATARAMEVREPSPQPSEEKPRMPIDFAALSAKMSADRERRAGLTPEAIAAEDAKRRVGVNRMLDAETFGSKPLRTVDLVVSETGGMGRNGERIYFARNDRGPVKLVLPEDRYDDMARGNPALNEAFNGALNATQKPDFTSALPVQATGVFKSRTFKNPQGAEVQSWDFVATKFTFEHEGKTHTVGRDVARDEPQKAAAPVQEKAAPKKTAARDEAR